MPNKTQDTPITPGSVIVSSLISAPYGALIGGINGVIGRTGASFFNPAIAGAAGTFGTFAAMGLITAPLTILPGLLLDNVLDNSEYLKKHPMLKEFLHDTSWLLLGLAAVSSAALMIGLPPLGASVISMMVLPVAYYALKQLCNVVNACLGLGKADESTLAPTASII